MPWYVNLLIVLAVLVVPVVLGNSLARRWRMPEYATRISVVLFCLFAGIAVVWSGWPPKLGIDLRGGVILVYEIDEETEAPQPGVQEEGRQGPEGGTVDMDKLIAAVARRVNPGGVKEVTIREYGPKQIEIIIPEADQEEIERMKRIISSVGTLEFRILANNRDHKPLIERAEAEDSREIRSQDGKLLAWWVPVSKGQEQSFQGYGEIARRTRERRGQEFLEILVVNDNFNVTGGYLAQATTGIDERGRPNVRFRFDGTGARLFGGLTSNNLPDEVQDFSRKLGIILDGYLYSAPAIRSTITREGEITGEFTQKEVEELVDVLNAGSLPAALTKDPISQLATGPTLGRDTIRRGAFSIGLSLVLVLAFMVFYYRFSGIIACGALLMNLVLILAIMIMIKAAFTLPGLAGLVLTVGMAVDANVLIFERLREELDRQATLRMAIRNGFGKALSAIVDSNITTLITATILYVVGTDQIKGFAVTLWLGVVLSMFTAIYCARTVFDVAERRKWVTKLGMMRMLTHTNFGFLDKWPIAATGSVALILIGLAGVFARGQGLLDIDFTGGVSVETVFDQPQPISEIRASLSDLPDLVVADVQVAGEEPGRRFMVNTSSPPGVDAEAYLTKVEQHIHDVFGEKLSSNSVKVAKLEPIPESPGAAKPDEQHSPQPASGTQSWFPGVGGVRASSLLASLLPGQADESVPAGAPESPPAISADPKPAAAEAEQTPAAKTGTETPQQPAAAEGTGEKSSIEERPAPSPASPEQPAAPEASSKTAATVPDRFAGGTVAQLKFDYRIDYDTLQDLFRQVIESGQVVKQSVDFDIQREGYEEGDSAAYLDWTVKIQLPPQEAERIFAAVDARLHESPFFPSSSTIGGKVAGSTRVQAIYALLGSLLCIVGYLWVRFQRVMYGLAAVIALVHDVLITLGLIALSAYVASLLGFLLIDPFKIGLSVLAAFLTIIGYSLNDTIVVFDRIREVRGKAPRLTREIINTSINQTLSRTLLTSLTTLLVVVILYIGGGQGIHAFAFALLVGIVVGTYSSIFVASPILLWMSQPSREPGQGQQRKTAAPQTVS